MQRRVNSVGSVSSFKFVVNEIDIMYIVLTHRVVGFAAFFVNLA